jgi:hypothetical protein
MSASGADGSHVWYVAYGSNLCLDRLRCYLFGGRPPGALRTYPSNGKPSEPVDIQPTWLEGGLRFAGRSSVWGGGVACYDPQACDRVAARAYLLPFEQVRDLVAHEIRQPIGSDPGVGEAMLHASARISTGIYDTLVRVGSLSGCPMVTLATTNDPELAPPTAAYLSVVAAGLAETYRWSDQSIADYLLSWPGMGPAWTRSRFASRVTAGMS